MPRHTEPNRRHFLAAISAAALAPHGFTSPASLDDPVEISPRPLDDILVNPGIGFETADSFQGDRKPRNYPASSIAYFRIYWDRLEPEDGKYAFDLIDSLLEKARERGQDLALRFMPMDTEPKAPAWFRARGEGFTYEVKAAGWERGLKKGQLVETWAPDFNSPFFLDRQQALVQAFGERYNGHPDIIRMDIGSIGRWGEWHTSGTPVPMPTEQNALRVIDWYFKYWSRTPLTMLIGYAPGLRHAVSRGAGWRADSLGDYGHFSDRWSHMVDAYPKFVAAPGVLEAWKHGPVTFEPPGSMQDLERYVPTSGPGYDAMFDQALAWGASSYNAKSAPIPDAQVASIDRFLKRCGYRLALRSLRHPRSVAPGANLDLQMRWENLGVAPPYHPAILAIRLSQAGRSVVLDTDAILHSWLPGTHEIITRLPLPASLPVGDHDLAIAILAPHTHQPEIKLAIADRAADGWYTLGKLEVR